MTLMKPKKTSGVPDSKDYIYEIKYDGGSSVIKINKGKVEIRHGDNPDDQTRKYPELVEELKNCADGEYIAELCVIDKEHIGGHFPYFLRRQCQEFFKIKTRAKQYPITAQIHDVIESGGDTLTDSRPLMERKAIIDKNIKESEHVKIVRYYDSPAPISSLKGSIEGIIAKRKDSQYRMNSREGWWKERFNQRKVVTFVRYEEWHKEERDSSGAYTVNGIVLITTDGKRATLAGPRVPEAKTKVDTGGKVDVLLEFHEETEDGYRFPVVVEVY